MKRHLAPGGRLMFDIFNPGIEFMVERSRARREVKRFTHPHTGQETVVEEIVSYDTLTQVNRTTWFYSVTDGRDVSRDELHLRCYYPEEINALLHYNGFEVIEKVGDYDGRPFSSTSSKQIMTCRV